jgi:thiol-disulfide isomerase/thioredoxin
MKKLIIHFTFFFVILSGHGQGLVNIGDNAPKYNFTKIINAPISQIDLSELKGKPVAIAFWGTWCAPCIPEMINLQSFKGNLAAKCR